MLVKFVLAFGLALGLAGAVHAKEFNHILIVSIDAWHPDSIGPETTPTVEALLKKGNYTFSGQSTTPPKTLISHTAMVTGLQPEENGKTDNLWQPGQPRVSKPTIFHIAKASGYRTGYFYSKSKLGYLVNPGIDLSALDSFFALEKASAFLKEGEGNFVFLHISGLDSSGKKHGWLSGDYLETLYYIDLELKGVADWLESEGGYLLVLTSDHAGHGKEHGTSHPEDYKLPLIIVSDRMKFPGIQGEAYRVTDLKGILEKVLMSSP